MNQIQRFFEDLRQKRVAFIGTGVSHTELISVFRKKGIGVTVLDKRSADKFQETYDALAAQGVQFILGEDYLEHLTEFDVVFRTPGMYFNNPAITKAREAGVVITSEMESFFDLCPCKIYGVTGSDGKSTSTTLIAEILAAHGKTVHKGGNIGRALLPIIEEIGEDDAAVVELSSFQLISMRKSPDTALITNITPNHLDVHGTMEEYTQCKINLLAHQNGFSRTVLNFDNEGTRALAPLVRGRLNWFTRREIPERGAFLREDGMLCYIEKGEITPVVHKDDIRIPGMHNVENFLGVIAALWGDVDIADFVKVAKEFGGVEHRIEFVREVGGVKWYNDSIATSPTRVLAGLRSFDQKIIVLAGGYDKKIPFEPMAETVCDRVKLLILMGVTAEKIEKAVTSAKNYDPAKTRILHADSMEQAVEIAHREAKQGDIVTLSPACASFDWYPNFEVRGQHFKRLVGELS
ncbi:MAG: UDP-N-acetylmuramoyl-L-alanine--D-glutamate ligase [Oscillospiraceae bacterium]|nr:UDP-N-acetylmuramoyl-L-alanine--D-glutamate ligase [Oscillospiraceae bacterium]MBQ9696051.1 UDP-N-acetylmuramoyl-L-alanine--D-glutamate ligase [Oscillospiraceae bacterium]